jgi:lipopolysaccharide biosynthesis glycosyltransferase
MMNISFSDAILNEQHLLPITTDVTGLHVAFGLDANYIKGMGITILSLLETNRRLNFVFHVFYNSITTDELDKLKQLVTEKSANIILYQINNELFKNLPTFAQFTAAIYNRLVVANKLKDVAAKVLYLDADIVCLGDISEIATINMGDNIVAAVQDAEHAVSRQTEKLNIKGKDYFNSGVIYIDINKWHDNAISEKTLELLNENGSKFSLPDQDALNIALADKVLFLGKKWNCLFDTDQIEVPADTLLLHYAGRTKPWCEWYVNPARNHFLKYYRQSPWRNVEFDKPTQYKHMKAAAVACRKKGDLLQSIYWYFKYIYTRIR